MIKIRKGSWSLACATLVLGFMLADRKSVV